MAQKPLTSIKFPNNSNLYVVDHPHFNCIYDSTTYDAIIDAITDGFLPICQHEGSQYILSAYNENIIYFGSASDKLYTLSVTSEDVWNTTEVDSSAVIFVDWS